MKANGFNGLHCSSIWFTHLFLNHLILIQTQRNFPQMSNANEFDENTKIHLYCSHMNTYLYILYSPSLLLEQVEEQAAFYAHRCRCCCSLDWMNGIPPVPVKKKWNRFNLNQNDFNHGNYISTNNCLMLKFTSLTGRKLAKYKARTLMCSTYKYELIKMNLIQFVKSLKYNNVIMSGNKTTKKRKLSAHTHTHTRTNTAMRAPEWKGQQRNIVEKLCINEFHFTHNACPHYTNNMCKNQNTCEFFGCLHWRPAPAVVTEQYFSIDWGKKLAARKIISRAHIQSEWWKTLSRDFRSIFIFHAPSSKATSPPPRSTVLTCDVV